MKKIIVSLLKPYKSNLLKAFCFQILRGLFLLLTAWSGAEIVHRVFILREAVQAAALDFWVLLFSLSITAFCNALLDNSLSYISTEMRHNLRLDLHREFLRKDSLQPLENSGALLSLLGETVDALDEVFHQVIPVLLALISHTLIFLIAFFILDPISGVMFLIAFPIAPFLLSLIGKETKNATERQWKNLLALNVEFNELLSTLLTLKIFRRVCEQEEQLKKLSDSFSTSSLAVLKIAFISTFALELITTLAIAIIAVWTGLRLLDGELDFLIAFELLILSPLFFAPLRQSGLAFHAGMSAVTALEKLTPYIQTSSKSVSTYTTKIQLPPFVEVKNLSFQYPGRIDATFENLFFTLEQNTTTILTGESGSGKSTILRLLAGLIPPQAGSIELSGKTLSDIAPEELPRIISYVPQEPHIFSGNVRENLLLNVQDNTSSYESDAALKLALKKAALYSWLESLPHGLNTMLGTGARTLSLGERHRFGLARAIYQNTPLVLLDEITAGLDEASELQILEILDEFCYRRTVLFAAHRPATIRWAKNILHLENKMLTYKKQEIPLYMGKEKEL